mgnify:FL=1|tara:strand:+ start:668 stop:850 length:183 start_codon:yes stop_codon:yes gene_type:complete
MAIEQEMTHNEKKIIKVLLEIEMDGLPNEKKDKVMEAFYQNKISFKNLQACLDKIATWHP